METTNPASHVMGTLVAPMTLPITGLVKIIIPVVPFTGTISKGRVFTIPVPVTLHIYLMFENSSYVSHVFWCAKPFLNRFHVLH